MNQDTQEQLRKAREEFVAAAAKADARADSLLLKVVRSKWSWAIILGALLAFWLLG